MDTSLKKKILIAAVTGTGVLTFGLFFNAAPNPRSTDFEALKAPYLTELYKSLDDWSARNVNTWVTGAKCIKKNPAYEGKDYITDKIDNLAGVLNNTAAVYPYVDQKRKNQILKISGKIFVWLEKQIDYNKSQVKDDYGWCNYSKKNSYGHLSTTLTVMGLHSYYKILPKNDPIQAKLKKSLISLATGHIKNSVPEDGDNTNANYSALNLTVLGVLNDVDPKNSVFKHLKDYIVGEYGWIRKSWINTKKEERCGMPLLYGGWSHQTPERVAKNNKFSLNCSYFDQRDNSPMPKRVRKFYMQKTSYHAIITEGLIRLRETLIKRKACGVVKYGSMGTCGEIEMILNSSAGWTLKMMKDNGSIAQAYASYPKDEWGYFTNNYGNVRGIRSLMNVVDTLYAKEKSTAIKFRTGHTENRKNEALSSYRLKIYNLLQYEIVKRKKNTLSLGDAYFVAAKKFPGKN